jgi:hypothetical protein
MELYQVNQYFPCNQFAALPRIVFPSRCWITTNKLTLIFVFSTVPMNSVGFSVILGILPDLIIEFSDHDLVASARYGGWRRHWDSASPTEPSFPTTESYEFFMNV